jgi:polysaccharide biosynthesis protein PslG
MSNMLRVLAAIALTTALLVAAPAAEGAKRKVPRGFYGVMWDRSTTWAPFDEQERQWALMAQSGVESVRTVFSWAKSEPAKGGADLWETDNIMELAARHNIAVLPIVQDTPGWAARPPGGYGAIPANVSDFTDFLQLLVRRYGPSGSFWAEHPELPRRPLREWQIWNEPHIDFYWDTDGRSRNAWAREYARMLKASNRAIARVDPGATIVLAALADRGWDHLALLNRYRVRRAFDVATFNLFTSRPENVIKGVRRFRREMRRGGERRKQIWLTETTWPAGKGRVPTPGPDWQRAWYTTDAGMASRLRRFYALAVRQRRKLRLGRVYWYTWASEYESRDLFDYAGLNRWSGNVFESLPALAAYRASARRYQGCAKTAEGACAP